MSSKKKRALQILVQLVLVAILVAGGFQGFQYLKNKKPAVEKHQQRVSIPVVRTVAVADQLQPVMIKSEGTVTPLHEIQLVPQVSGKVLRVADALVDGGAFKAGDVLVEIESKDYALYVTQAEAQIKDTLSNLQLLEEEAAVAKEEWRFHAESGRETMESPPPLVAKEPQLAAIRAKLAADRAKHEKTLLDLARTRIQAPFDGRVSDKNVDVGQYVTSGQVLATLHSTDAVEIVLPMEDGDLYWFHVPGFTPGRGRGAAAVVYARVAGRENTWQGRVVRATGKVDARTRMINVVVLVMDPYAALPPLVPGLFVEVEIKGRMLAGATEIPRSALNSESVWVVDADKRLRYRKVKVARLFQEKALIAGGLESGETVMVSTLQAATDGMQVRVMQEKGENGS